MVFLHIAIFEPQPAGCYYDSPKPKNVFLKVERGIVVSSEIFVCRQDCNNSYCLNNLYQPTDRGAATFPNSLTFSHLKQRMMQQEIEKKEQVQDPFRFTVPTPFGYRLKAWQGFIESLPPSCELWAFTHQEGTPCGDVVRTEGYAALLNENIVAHFMASTQTLQEIVCADNRA